MKRFLFLLLWVSVSFSSVAQVDSSWFEVKVSDEYYSYNIKNDPYHVNPDYLDLVCYKDWSFIDPYRDRITDFLTRHIYSQDVIEGDPRLGMASIYFDNRGRILQVSISIRKEYCYLFPEETLRELYLLLWNYKFDLPYLDYVYRGYKKHGREDLVHTFEETILHLSFHRRVQTTADRQIERYRKNGAGRVRWMLLGFWQGERDSVRFYPDWVEMKDPATGREGRYAWRKETLETLSIDFGGRLFRGAYRIIGNSLTLKGTLSGKPYSWALTYDDRKSILMKKRDEEETDRNAAGR